VHHSDTKPYCGLTPTPSAMILFQHLKYTLPFVHCLVCTVVFQTRIGICIPPLNLSFDTLSRGVCVHAITSHSPPSVSALHLQSGNYSHKTNFQSTLQVFFSLYVVEALLHFLWRNMFHCCNKVQVACAILAPLNCSTSPIQLTKQPLTFQDIFQKRLHIRIKE
jgi:hypothetical protein